MASQLLEVNMNRTLRGVVVALVLSVVGLTAPANADGPTYPERVMARCSSHKPAQMDADQQFPCVWDGLHSGVTTTRSFIIRKGNAPGWYAFAIINHERAHRLWMPVR